MSDAHEPDAVRQFLKVVRDTHRRSLRDAADRMPRERALSRTSLSDRLSGKHPIQDVGELDALVVAFGGSREDRARALTLYRSTRARRAPRSTPAADPRSAPKDRDLIRAMLDDLLPASQLTAGNGDMLAEVAVDELEPGERLHLLYPCRSARSMGGSALLMVTDRDVVLVELIGIGVAGSRQRRPPLHRAPGSAGAHTQPAPAEGPRDDPLGGPDRVAVPGPAPGSSHGDRRPASAEHG